MLKKILILIRDNLANIKGAYNSVMNKLLFNVKNVTYQTFPRINGRVSIFKNGSLHFW